MATGRKVYVEPRGKSIRLKWRFQGAWQSHTLYGKDGRSYLVEAKAAIQDTHGCNIMGTDPRLEDGSLYRPAHDLAPMEDTAGTFGEMALEVIHKRRKGNAATRAQQVRELEGPAFARWLRVPVRTITAHDVNAWMAETISGSDQEPKREGSYAAGTVRRYGQLIRSALHLAEDGGLCKDEWRRIVLPAPDNAKHAKKAMQIGQVEAIIAATSDPMYAAIWDVMAFTGLRSGELRALKAGSVDLELGRLTVDATVMADRRSESRGKSRHAERTLPLRPHVVDRLRPYVVGKRAGAYVFATPAGERIPHQTFSAAWLRARKLADLPDARIHDLRHCFASLLLNDAAMPLAAASKMLGHGSIAITADIYHHLGDDSDRQALEALGRYAPENRPTQIRSRRKAGTS